MGSACLYRLCLGLFVCLSLPFLPATAQDQGAGPADSAKFNRSTALTGTARAICREAERKDARCTSAMIGIARIDLDVDNWREAEKWVMAAMQVDPENIHIRYYNAVVLQRRVKNFAYSGRLSEAEAAFAWVIERDSLYEDVLYQYALLHHYNDRHDQAVKLAEAQVRLRPDLIHVHRGLYNIYQAYLAAEDARRVGRSIMQRAAATVGSAGGDGATYASSMYHIARTYFQGEALRQSGNVEEAEAVFMKLLSSDAGPFRTPVLLSLGKIKYAERLPFRGQAFVKTAIEEITTKAEADFVFDDFKFIFTPEELHQYERINGGSEFRDFFNTFWIRRDPLPGSEVNVRMLEHYRRLLKAERDYPFVQQRTWYNNPDRHGEYSRPPTYYLNNKKFDDMGLIYIRHGEPDDWETHIDQSTDMNMSWRYYEPYMDFHFIRQNNWRLTTVLSGSIARSRGHWGSIYTWLLQDRKGALDRFVRQMNQYMHTGLTTDRHTWPDNIQPLEVPHLIAQFRGERGLTDLQIHYALPTGLISYAARSPVDSLVAEIGTAAHDSAFRPVIRETFLQRFEKSTSRNSYYANTLHLGLAPGKYNLALSVIPQDTELLGGYKWEEDVTDFSEPVLSMSDVVPASGINILTFPAENRSDVLIQGNPGLEFKVSDAVYLYFEIYNLTLGDTGQTSYSIEYILTPEPSISFIWRLFTRRDRPTLSLATELGGNDNSPIEYAEIDVRQVPPGRYDLTVLVRDLYTGGVVERSRRIVLAR